jgi:Fic family protein
LWKNSASNPRQLPGRSDRLKIVSDDLPIYSESILRTRLQFSDLERLKGADMTGAWAKSDDFVGRMEGGANVGEARTALAPTKEALRSVHGTLFRGREGAGRWRSAAVTPLFRGQDCPPPGFIERSVDNFISWLGAESFGEIHPIEKAALLLTRIVDIWPFDFGNLSVGVMFANMCLGRAGLGPFFVLPEHLQEFNTVVGRAIAIETQPLVNVIHSTVKREMEALGRR